MSLRCDTFSGAKHLTALEFLHIVDACIRFGTNQHWPKPHLHIKAEGSLLEWLISWPSLLGGNGLCGWHHPRFDARPRLERPRFISSRTSQPAGRRNDDRCTPRSHPRRHSHFVCVCRGCSDQPIPCGSWAWPRFPYAQRRFDRGVRCISAAPHTLAGRPRTVIRDGRMPRSQLGWSLVHLPLSFSRTLWLEASWQWAWRWWEECWPV